MNIKLSKYTFDLGQNEGRTTLYHAATGAVIRIGAEFHDLLSRCEAVDAEDIPEPLLETTEQLFRMGFLVDAAQNENDFMVFKHNSAKYDKTTAAYIVYPTLGCNFDCPYCFEEYKNETISPEQITWLKKFIEIKSRDLKHMSMRWSGGEPLLIWDKIRDMGASFLDSCLKNSVSYQSSIATNGYFITDAIAREMLDIKITNAQITLEGPPSLHNRRRFTHNGEPTFHRILEGVIICGNYMNVAIRVNIDRNNADYFPELLETLNKYTLPRENLRLFCKPVRKGVMKENDPSMFLDGEFYDIEKRLIEQCMEAGFAYSLHPGVNKSMRCPYYHINSFIIGPDLSAYKCAEFIGVKSRAVGHIMEGGLLNFTDFPAYLKCSAYSPFDVAECRECKVLPLCFGKCPIIWEENNRRPDAGCIPEKHTITDKIKYALCSGVQMKQWEAL